MRRLKTVRRPPIYPKTPGHLPCSSLTHPLPLSSRRPSVSFGGFGVIEEPGIRALVVDSTYADASELLAQETARKTVFPRWLTPIFIPASKLMAKQIYGIDIDELVPEVAVAQLDYPILVIHGTADERIPFDHGERVHRSAHPDSVIWLVPDVDHVDAFLTHPDEYERRVVEYFESRLTFRQ